MSVPIPNSESLVRERNKSWMLRAWILSGIFFMALPGTLLGFSNLMAISAHHGLGSMSPAWMEGHGHAQMYGWIGSFILGIGFYSQPARRSGLRIPIACFAFWTTGVLLRWIGNIYEWHWRSLLLVSSAAELIAVLLFLSAASHHKLPEAEKGKKKSMEIWMVAVLLSTAGLTAAVIFNFVECLRLALYGATPSFPHLLDQKYLVLLGWGFLAPVVWGFSARWLPSFLAIDEPRSSALKAALVADIVGVLTGVSGLLPVATSLFFVSAVSIVFALHLIDRPHGQAKTQGIHPSFPYFIRLAYVWLVIAASMSVWAALADQHGGIWGASRHALTVGFAATMVFSIGPRILPHFCGIARLFSTRLMFASLLLLQVGCTLRVSSEPLAYEGFSSFAWRVLPVSGMLELAAVLIFAANIAATIIFGRSAFTNAQTGEVAAA
ncbi:MAG: hypothetical protein JST28_00675 [Acidobacteria bacterium]|nr:hypothetical protein [Acidobacteriota bacterium]